jgi:hypothetical protein
MPEPDQEFSTHAARSFMHEVHDLPYKSFASLAEARRDPDAAVVLSGDDGGQIFLTVPVRLLRCDTAALGSLLSDLDAVSMMPIPPSSDVELEVRPVGTGVMGGMGGGVIIEGVWIHPELPEEIAAQARLVVAGERERIDGRLLRKARQAEIQRVQAEYHPDDASWGLGLPAPAIPFPES